MATNTLARRARRFRLGAAASLGLVLCATGALAEANGLSRAVTALAADVRELERRYTTLSADIADQRKRLTESKRALHRREAELAALAARLVAENTAPGWLALFAPESAVDQARRAAYTRWLADRTASARTALQQRIAAVREQQAALVRERKRLRALAEGLQARRGALIARLGEDWPMPAADADRQMQALADRLDDLGALLNSVDRSAPQGDEAEAARERGIMLSTLPVGGRLLSGFNRSRGREGVRLATAPGAFVYAPAAGTVAFAGPFRRYGVVLILKHDDGYHSVITGLHRLAVDVGAPVTAGQPIGTVQDDGETSEIYYELRRGGRPVDPVASLTPYTQSDRQSWENGQ